MGFHRKIQPAALDRAGIASAIVAEAAFIRSVEDPFLIDHDCLNPGGHDFTMICGELVCPHCAKVVWQ